MGIFQWLFGSYSSCRECGTEMIQTTVCGVEGSYGAIRIEIDSFPVLQWPKDGQHPRKWLRSSSGEGFGIEFVDQFFHDGDFPVTEKAGGFGTTACRFCGTELVEDRTRQDTISGEIGIEGIPRVRLRLTGPVVTCDGCGRDQLLFSDQDSSDMMDSMIDIFRKARIER